MEKIIVFTNYRIESDCMPKSGKPDQVMFFYTVNGGAEQFITVPGTGEGIAAHLAKAREIVEAL